jgi:HK97 family phage portal protein
MLGVPYQGDGRSAENVAAVFGCVQAISSALASLPVIVYRRKGELRIEEPTHPLARLVKAGPNARQSWPDFIEWVAAQSLLKGNALVEVVRDGAGEVHALEPVPWEWVTVLLLPTGRLAFDVQPNTQLGVAQRRRRLLQGECIHLKDRSDDGYVGRPRLARASDVLSGAVSAQMFAGSFFKNAATPSGVIETPQRITDDGIARLREQLEKKFTGPSKAGKVLILDQNLKWSKTSLSPEDSELLETRRFGVEEICRIFQVPPPIVQDYTHNTFTNSEAAGRWFAQFTIGPWARKLEAEFARAVFPEGAELEIEFDMSAFLRGDPNTRWQAHQIAIASGVLSPNEVRQIEGWNPRPGGDEFAQSAKPTKTTV